MVMISERPAEVADRAVPGHWEGDLIMGKDNLSAVGTLVERSTRYTLLLHLGAGKDALSVKEAMKKAIRTLPSKLVKTITWDQEGEMGRHVDFTIETKSPSTSAIPTRLGNADRTKTPMACCANTCQRAPISQSTARKIWLGSLEASMIVLA